MAHTPTLAASFIHGEWRIHTANNPAKTLLRVVPHDRAKDTVLTMDIIRAVNAHDDLMQFTKRVAAGGVISADEMNAARAALAKAKANG